jgi:LytS/YehU family sensor histidine kinase
LVGLWPDGLLDISNQGELLISGITNLYQLPITSLYQRELIAPLNLTNIIVSGKELAEINNVNTLDTLVLNYNQNQLSFEFAALSFLPHEANTYACMLQGLDTSWQQLGSNNSITYANLNHGKYVFKVKTANRYDIWSEEKKLYIEIKPAFWQTVWFKTLIALIIASTIYWLFRNHLYRLNLKNQLEKEKLVQQKREAEFQKKLGDLTLSALRSQINPHFIFNCLNSIKLYTTQHDVDAATEYLTKFSKLIRQVLNNCKNERILLSEELEVLQLYIEMEAMRFKDKLQYSIIVEDYVEADYIEVPPLLLQPYVENAIWHGLMNKEEGGHLNIAIKMENNNTLIISIKDDGIGRAKAAELKSQSHQQHKSFGMSITSERLALIKELYNTETTITISDLTDGKNIPAGTLVIIQIQI